MNLKPYMFAIAVVGPLAVAPAGTSFAAAVTSSATMVKTTAPASATEVQYKRTVAPQYWNYDPSYNHNSYYDEDYWRGVRGVVPYGNTRGYDPLRGSYFDDVAPY
jgi:hypothetical protein